MFRFRYPSQFQRAVLHSFDCSHPSPIATTRDMEQHNTSAGWTAERGEKWRARLAEMEAMLIGIDPPLIEALHLNQPCRIADIGCGGGGTAIAIAAAAPAGSIVHGYDLSPALVTLAASRTSNVPFSVADMSTAPPPAPLYHRLVSRFGTMFFADPAAAFANIAQWLTPGGRFAFAVWGPVSDNPWMEVVRQLVGQFVPLPPLDLTAPGPFRYADTAALLPLLDQAGFGSFELRKLSTTLPIGGGLNADDAARFALSTFSNFGELLAAHGALETARHALARRFAGSLSNGIVSLNAGITIIAGRRLE